MLNQSKLIFKKNENKRNGQKAIILSAAIGSLVASGSAPTSGTGGENIAPTLGSDALSISVEENQSVVVTVDAADTDALTFAISGDDAKYFSIDETTGTLAFKDGPDFEAAADKDGDNSYNIDVTVTDAGGLSASGTAVINVTNVNEAANFASNAVLKVNVAEGVTAVANMTATDPEVDELTYALSGDDAELFNVSSAGAVTFKDAPDYEVKADVGADGVYNLTVTATDPDGLSAGRDVEVKVTNINEAVSFADGSTLNVSVAENQNIVASVAAIDADGDDLIYKLTGDDAALFEINATGDLTFITNPDYETKADANADGIYNVTVTATDPAGLSATRDVAITVTNVAEYAAASYHLAALDGMNGFTLNGVNTDDDAGYSVSNAGDVNGDGIDDFIIGAHKADNQGTSSGSAYVVFGKLAGFDEVVELSDLVGTNGFRIDGVNAHSSVGESVSAAGDFNGDGYDDVIVSAAGDGFGKAYVIFGKASEFAATMHLDGIASSEAAIINSSNAFSVSIGKTISGAGDVNGDGYDDILIGTPDWNGDGTAFTGAAHVLFGNSNPGAYNLDFVNGLNGFALLGVDNFDSTGFFLSDLGDINGDGFADFAAASILSGIYDELGNFLDIFGEISVIYGQADFSSLAAGLTINTLADYGFKIYGNMIDSYLGTISSAGDINGDGYDDIFIGDRSADNGGAIDSGGGYILFGKATKYTDDMSISEIDGTNGFRIDGATEFDSTGFSVSSAGDINGDGFDDLLIGTPFTRHNDLNNSGTTYVLYGSDKPFDVVTKLADLDGTNGFKLDGALAEDHSGYSVSTAGDVNGDGYDDLLIGAPRGADGQSHIFYGSAEYNANANIGLLADDVLNGDETDNNLNGGQGNDVISGMAGEDVLIGGFGADTLNGGTDNDRMWGGAGQDIFEFAAGDSLIALSGAGDTGSITGFDTILDFTVNNENFNSETYKVDGGISILADTNSTNGDDSAMTIGGNAIASHRIDAGIISFSTDNVYSSAIKLGAISNVAAVVQYMQLQDFGDAGTTAAFDVGADSFIFTQGADDGQNSKDILVRLEDVQVDSLTTTNGLGEFDLFIA